MNKAKLIIGLFVLAGLFGCTGMTKGKEASENAVIRFHQQLDAGQFKDIYNESADKFREVVKEPESQALFEAVHRKLGTVKTAQVKNWRLFTSTTGNTCSLVYDTEFSEGHATEEFVYGINGDQVSLINYNINSPILITK